jgi:hypothetical protein
VPTPTPTPKPTPVPSPTPKPIGSLNIGLTGCPGGVAIGWSPAGGPVAKYRTLRNTSSSIPVAYPPTGGAVEVPTAKAGAGMTSAYDASGMVGATYHYRTLALDASGAVIATSGVASAAAQPVVGLGPLVVAPDAGGTRFSWTPFTGSPACFTYYKLVYSLDGSPPSYVEGDPHLMAIGEQGTATAVSADLAPGATYTLRLQAIRATDTGPFVVAQTEIASYTAP